MRERVLGRVRAELLRERRRQTWSFVAGLAAAAILWINLSIGLTIDAGRPVELGADVASDRVLCRQIHDLLPEWSEEEVVARARTLQGVRSLSPWSELSGRRSL
jgi:hypothetical protein